MMWKLIIAGACVLALLVVTLPFVIYAMTARGRKQKNCQHKWIQSGSEWLCVKCGKRENG